MRAGHVIWAAVVVIGCSRPAEVVAPPEISLVNASPIAVGVGESVRLTCSATGLATGVVTYRWSVSAKDRPAEGLDGIAVDWKAARPGKYVATCTASNPRGSDIKTVSFTVEGNAAAPSHASGAIPKSPISVKVACGEPRVKGGEEVRCTVEVAGATQEPTLRWKTSFGSVQSSGTEVTLKTPNEAPRGGQQTALVEVEATTPTGVGTGSTAVLVDVRACEKATLERTPTVAFRHETAGDPREPAARPRDAGVSEARPPTAGLAGCQSQITSCVAQSHSHDECVKSAARCQSTKPWLGDPAGADCCPIACVETYFKTRGEQCETEAFQSLLESACYPADPGEIKRP